MTLAEFETLKRQVDTARRTADRSAGAVAELTKRLQTEFGCDSLKAAKRKLQKMETETAELERKFETALAAFENEYPDNPSATGE